MLNKFLFMIFAVFFLTLAGTSHVIASPGGGHGGGHGGSGGGQDSLTQDEIDGLLFMREEEKVARDSYITLGELWKLVVFENIASSEQNHMDALKKLLDKYELNDPVIPGVGEFTNTDLQELYDLLMAWGEDSLMDGLHVGATIEETDIIDIQSEIELARHEDIISTYESLMCGSRNHLRAFAHQIEANGGVYDPSDDYFEGSDEFFIEIANSPMERDCESY